jgi:hypothetical protein
MNRGGVMSLIWLAGWLVATPVLAAQDSAAKPARVQLDSGSIVRFRWTDGLERARLLAPLTPDSVTVRYCRYPSPVCGAATINPVRIKSVGELTGLEVRHGSRSGHGALVGAGIGTGLGLLGLLAYAVRDTPALSTRDQLVFVVVSAGVWAGLGALVGAASDDWARVPGF